MAPGSLTGGFRDLEQASICAACAPRFMEKQTVAFPN
jgi:hypothetical protein